MITTNNAFTLENFGTECNHESDKDKKTLFKAFLENLVPNFTIFNTFFEHNLVLVAFKVFVIFQ